MALFKPNVEKMKKKQDVEGLIKALKHKDGAVQKRAIEALVDIGEPAIDPLIQALKHEDWRVRDSATETLGKIGDARAVEPLVQVLMAGGHPRRAIADALDRLAWQPSNDAEKARYLIAKKRWHELIGLGRQAVEPLLRVLKPGSGVIIENVRKIATHTLARLGEQAVEPLIQALEDKEWVVRLSAAEALGKIGDVRAVEPLTQALKDEDWIVRMNAVWALGNIGEARAVEFLIQALESGDIGDIRTVESRAQAFLKQKEWYVVRGRSAGAVVGSPVQTFLQHVRARSAEALRRIGNVRAIGPLKQALKGQDSEVQRAAQEALEKIEASLPTRTVCSQCGSEVRPGRSFCTTCGTKLS